MKGNVAQFVALTCYGNAKLRALPAPSFGLEHSTCMYCRSVRFFEFAPRDKDGMRAAKSYAESPSEWFAKMESRGVKALHMPRGPYRPYGMADRTTAAFAAAGDRTWRIEAPRQDGTTDVWLARWQVVDSHAADRRIWEVEYGLVANVPDLAGPVPDVAPFREALRSALADIHRFAVAQKSVGFANCFAEATRRLDDSSPEGGYSYNVAPPGALSPEAASVLKAAQSAWVFGGMGSWNDLWFEGDVKAEYERVSERLYQTLAEAIQVAASSSAKF